MGVIELELRCPRNLNGIAADPSPDWSFDNLLSELDAIEEKVNKSLSGSVSVDKKQSRKLRALEEDYLCTRGFVMHLSDHELDISDSETEEVVDNSSRFPDRRFGLDKSYMRVEFAEGALHELIYELQFSVSEEIRNKISTLEKNLVDENEKFASQITRIEKQRKTQQDMERKIDLQFQLTIAEALGNHLTAVQRDHEHISQLEERRIINDAAREEVKRKEKTLLEERIHQEQIKAEEETRLQAERVEQAKAAAIAEKQAAEAATSKHATETLREDVNKGVDHFKGKHGQSESLGFDEKQVQLSVRNAIKASENALELEERRQQIYKKLSTENESLRASSNQAYRRRGQNFNRLIKTISATVENVRTKADELFYLINNPECPQSISVLAFVEKVISNCENSQKSNGFIFACSRVIVLVTSKIPLATDILIAELNRVCMYTVPKYIEYSPVAFKTKEDYFKSIGYREVDGKIESTDSYVERLSAYMKLYGALVQADIDGLHSILGLKEGWAWVARFLNSLPANLYTAVALQHFIDMCGYALYRRYRNQFEKLLRTIGRDFLGALKEGNSDSFNAKLIKVKTSILNYIESSQFKQEPEGLQLRGHLESNDYF